MLLNQRLQHPLETVGHKNQTVKMWQAKVEMLKMRNLLLILKDLVLKQAKQDMVK